MPSGLGDVGFGLSLPLDHSNCPISFVEQEDASVAGRVESQISARRSRLPLCAVLLLDDLEGCARRRASSRCEEDTTDRILAAFRESVRTDVKHFAARHVPEQ